jgi:hypothetical protein
MRPGRKNQNSRRRPALMSLCPLQIPYILTWNQTQAAMVGRQWLTTCTVAWLTLVLTQDVLKTNCLDYKGRFLPLLTGSWFCTLWRWVHLQLGDAYKFCWWIYMPVGWYYLEWSSYNWQITGGVENAAPLRVDIPCTGRRGSDLPFEAVLREYWQFLYGYFLLVLLFGDYCCKLCPLNNPGRKNCNAKDQVNMLAKYHCW